MLLAILPAALIRALGVGIERETMLNVDCEELEINSLNQVPTRVERRLTTHSTGLAISNSLKYDIGCSPVNSGVRTA